MDLNVKVSITTPDDLLNIFQEIKTAIQDIVGALQGNDKLSSANIASQIDEALDKLRTINSTQVLDQ